MKTTFYLTVKRTGTVKTTKGRPGLDWDEVAIQMNITLPDALFKKPQLQAEVTIPDEAAIPQLISAETISNVKEAIEQASGMEVKIQLVPMESARVQPMD